METLLSSRLSRIGQAVAGACFGLATALALILGWVIAGLWSGGRRQRESGRGRGRILLVLPFDNRSGQPSLEWIREAAPEILSSRFASAGFAPMSRADRLLCAGPSGAAAGVSSLARHVRSSWRRRWTRIRSWWAAIMTDGTGIVAEAQVVDVPHLRMSEAVTARGEMQRPDCGLRLAGLEADPAARSRLQRAPRRPLWPPARGCAWTPSSSTSAASPSPTRQERLRHLKQAVKLSPEFGPAWMALGREDYNGQQYEQAAAAFAKVGSNEPDALEAGFYRGLVAAVFRRLSPRPRRRLPAWRGFCRWPRW